MECELGQGSPTQSRQFPKLPKGTLSAPSVGGGVGMGGWAWVDKSLSPVGRSWQHLVRATHTGWLKAGGGGWATEEVQPGPRAAPSHLPSGPHSGQNGLESSGQGSMRKSLCGAAPGSRAGDGQGMSLRASRTRTGPSDNPGGDRKKVDSRRNDCQGFCPQG